MHVIGQNVDLTYPYNYLGEGAADLGAALKDKEWLQSFKEAKYPVVLVGPGILQRPDRDAILQQARDPACMPLLHHKLTVWLHADEAGPRLLLGCEASSTMLSRIDSSLVCCLALVFCQGRLHPCDCFGSA